MITQAIISAGGFGTRLRPFTDTMPKPMVPILGKPLLEWHIEQFKKHGVTEFFITLHYLPETIKDYFGDGSRFGVTITYFVEKEPMGSAGALTGFEDKLDDTFYYIYGDVFSMLDYTKMAEAYRTKEHPIGMQLMKRTEHYDDADVAELDDRGRFVKIHTKPHAEKHPNAYRMRGVFILDKRILAYLPADAACDLGKQLLPAAVASGENVYAYECDDYSKGIDTMEKLEEVAAYARSIKRV